MQKLKAYFAAAEKWVDDHPRQALIYGVGAVLVLAVLGLLT